MHRFKEYDVVEVTQLLRSDRPFDGSEGLARAPRIGDTGTIVYQYDPDDPDAPLVVESVDAAGYTVWLADFDPGELSPASREVDTNQTWLVIVDLAPLAQADEEFERWRSKNGVARSHELGEDLLIDTGRGTGGKDVRRYRISPSLASRLGLQPTTSET
jgi:hypothetical protein